MNSESKISPTIIRMVIVLVMAAGIGGVYLLSSGGGGGGVDLFTEDLAEEGIDPAAFIPEAAAAVADEPVNLAVDEVPGPNQALEFGNGAGNLVIPAAPDALALNEGGGFTAGNDIIEGPVEGPQVATGADASGESLVFGVGENTERVTTTFGTVGTTSNPTTTTTAGNGIFGPGVGFSPSPAPAQTTTQNTFTFDTAVAGNTAAGDAGVTRTPTTNTPQAAATPAEVPQATTPQATTQPGVTTPAVVQQDTTTPVTTPAAPAAPVGPWCQVEVRQTDGVIRWADDGRTTVIRRNDVWFHTPDENAQAILIPEAVNTNDQYVLRLWGGGTTDITCSFVSAAEAQPAPVAVAAAAPAAPEVATVAALPAPIAIPGGPVQMGFAADVWADDRTNYWNELDAVPGSGRLIAHEFKSFTKDIKTDVYRWHLESGRDLLLTWNGTDAETILNGSHDDWIREHARELRSLPGDVMLRFWHEPDVSHKRDWIDNDPQQFIDSWIYVRQIFAEENALNIEWVWCPTAWNWNEQGARYYPGDANVDWICSDGYTGWDLDAPLTDIADAYTDFQAWADQRPHKPILIAEFGAGQRGPGDRAEWVRSIPEWVSASPSIRAVVYFDVDRRPHGEIYDWRLRTEPDAWAQMMDVLSSAPFGR